MLNEDASASAILRENTPLSFTYAAYATVALCRLLRLHAMRRCLPMMRYRFWRDDAHARYRKRRLPPDHAATPNMTPFVTITGARMRAIC